MLEQVADMKARLVRSGVRQYEVATELGIDHTTLCKYLGGDQMPEGFPDRFSAALQALAIRKAQRLIESTGADAEVIFPDREPVAA